VDPDLGMNPVFGALGFTTPVTALLPLPFANIAAPPAKANAAKIFLFLFLLFFDIILSLLVISITYL